MRFLQSFKKPLVLTSDFSSKLHTRWFSNRFYNLIFQDCVDFKYKTVLDFGCGIGSSAYLFEPSNYFGVDCNDKRIKYAKELYPKHNFMTTKNGLLPLSPNSVDYIIILSVLHHIPTEQLTSNLKEFKRVLKSNGSVIIAEPCFFSEAHIPNWFMSNFDKGRYIRNGNQYLELFIKANYKTKVIKRYNQLLFYNKIMISACLDE